MLDMRSPYYSQSLLDALDQTIILLHQNKACDKSLIISKNRIYLYIRSLLCDKKPIDLYGVRLPKPFRVYIIIAYHLLFYKGLSRASLLISKLDEVESEMENDEKLGFRIVKIVSSLADDLKKFREMVLTERKEIHEDSIAEFIMSVLENELGKISVSESWVNFLKKIIEARLLIAIDDNFEYLVEELENEMKSYKVIIDQEVAEGYNIFETLDDTILSSIYMYYEDELKRLREEFNKKIERKKKLRDDRKKIVNKINELSNFLYILSKIYNKQNEITSLLFTIIPSGVIYYFISRYFHIPLQNFLYIVILIIMIYLVLKTSIWFENRRLHKIDEELKWLSLDSYKALCNMADR